MTKRLPLTLGVLLLFSTANPSGAADPPPPGVIVASVGEQVVLVEPASGAVQGFPTGPVAWLFPAPGGLLFAPDLVGGSTAVLDLRARRVAEHLEGVTMPRFGTAPDRYVVVAGNVLLVSYPERALITEVEAGLDHPWQVESTPDQGAVIVLEREPGSVGRSTLTAVDLVHRQVAFRLGLEGDVVRMALSVRVGALVMANRSLNRVGLLELSTLAPIAAVGFQGRPVDLVFAGDPELLVIAVAGGDGAGELRLWRLKRTKRGEVVRKNEHSLPLEGPPSRVVADPWGTRVAVVLAGGRLCLFDLRHRRSLASIGLPGEPRDVVWCDPNRPGPILPEWSDEKSRPLSLGVPPK